MQNINTKLEYWKNRLLDLGKRNRLINCPLPKDGKRIQRHSLLINLPAPEDIWSMLSDSDDTLSFPVPSNLYEDEHESEIELLSFTDIQTNQSPKETHKTLRSLMKKSKDFAEEKGLNALYLAFGFLNWVESGTEGQEMRSPLLLMPVKLTQKDLFSPIVLSRSDEEISVNYSLEQKLLNDFDIELPTLTEDTTREKFVEYLSSVAQAVKASGWNISNDVAHLSLFSFSKINMYRDLERNADKICGHHIIRVINGEALRDGASISGIEGYNHDNTEPQDVFSVIDSDSSQQDAILLARRGISFVLQGPPGTGKSQTITNIIAELIADGKKVLFVSEKMAALEVVFRRLTQTGLDPFCLTLHSHNAKRREILDQFDKSIKMSRQKAKLQQDIYNKLYRLKEVRNALNQYSSELHTPVGPLGKTIYQVNGYLAKYENDRNIDFVPDNPETFTPELLAKCELALKEVTRIVSKSGYQQNNPWNGCVLTSSPTLEFRQRFIVGAKKLFTQINEGLAIFDKINEILGINSDWALADIENIQRIFDCIRISPKVAPEWIALDLVAIIADLNRCVKFLDARNAAQATLDNLKIECAGIQLSVDNDEKVSQTGAAVSENIDAYNHAYESQKNLFAQKTDCLEKHRMAKTNYALDKDDYRKKQEQCKAREQNWQSSQKNLLLKYDKKILTLDINGMLSRYRTEYHTFFRRIGSRYKQDRRAMLACCKAAEKLTYEQGLSLLDSVKNVLNKKLMYERQVESTKIADKKYLASEAELDEISENLDKITIALSSAESKLSSERQNLLTAINITQSKCQAVLTEKEEILRAICQKIGDSLNKRISNDTDFNELISTLEWCINFKSIAKQYSFSSNFINEACNGGDELIKRTGANVQMLREWQSMIASSYEKFISLFDEAVKESAHTSPLTKLSEMVSNCKDNFASLESLVDYRMAEKELAGLGIDAYLMKAKKIGLNFDEIIPIFMKCFYRSWLDAVIPNYSSVQDFRRLRQDERVALFKDLDKSHLEISKAIVISKLVARLPNLDAFSANFEIALLRREMTKQRRLMPTRRLIAELPTLLPALKPCVMMSPLSISTYLGSNFEFDTVIFDEASQVRTEDAIGAIFRAKQVIIAGDSKQLPPTDFFTSSISTSDEYEVDEDGEVNDAGAYDSLLDEAIMLPTQTLLWHYRSRHEHLIAFSNAKIYQGNLITFPSAVENADGMGVEYIHVKGGVYDRGGKNGNKSEAAKVADLVFEHFHLYPGRSIGIIAFGEIQQSAILDALIEKRRVNPTFEPFFKEDREEPLFVKNLETVQGDERDTIILSIGYAPDAAGHFYMRFGPINYNGGERRLNVAITRARYNLKLVGSIMPTDINPERVSGQGPKLLRLYIDFAINGSKAILGEITEVHDSLFDSPFEASVHEFLTINGYDVATQVGCSGYRIDMAVRHPKYTGRFAIGVECDGATYHSARTARERDRLRQTVLEDMGWKIYRIWSTDWIKDRHTEGARLLDAVKDAINNYREIVPSSGSVTDL